jgi:hypothetical protein
MRLLDIRAEETRGATNQVRLTLMKIQLDGDLPRRGARVREVLRPLFDPESEKILGEGRLFAPLELRDGLESVDIAAIEHECVSILLSAVRRGTVQHDGWEF